MWCPVQREATQSLILRSVNFRPRIIYVSLGYQALGGGGAVSISQDGWSRVECVVRLMTVLLGLEMGVPGVERFVCLRFVIGPLSEIALC